MHRGSTLACPANAVAERTLTRRQPPATGSLFMPVVYFVSLW
jgi:hypothetical protein